MPELPEVETTIQGLRPVLMNARLTRVETRRPNMRYPFPPDLVQVLTGAMITKLSRRAKYGLIDTDRGATLIFHLGMSGRWRIDPAELERHDHLVLETAKHRIALCDPRRFGFVALVDTHDVNNWPPFAEMGPEPLGAELDVKHLHAAFFGRKTAVKLLLLDQRIIAGLGNIYACEALYDARIDPRKPGEKVSRAALGRLVPAIRHVLADAISKGGSTLRDYAQPDGELGYFAHSFKVYGKENAQCSRNDGGIIQRIAQSGRSTWFCPKCQK